MSLSPSTHCSNNESEQGLQGVFERGADSYNPLENDLRGRLGIEQNLRDSSTIRDGTRWGERGSKLRCVGDFTILRRMAGAICPYGIIMRFGVDRSFAPTVDYTEARFMRVCAGMKQVSAQTVPGIEFVLDL